MNDHDTRNREIDLPVLIVGAIFAIGLLSIIAGMLGLVGT